MLNSFRERSRWRLLLALTIIMSLLAAACTTDDTATDDTGPTETTAAGDDDAAAEVSNPGVLVHAADDEPTTLDPAQVEPGEGGETVILQVYERLLEISPTGPELVPTLATEVPTTENGLISADGLTYTFPIREGVTFHDGTALTADDVMFSWDRGM